MIQEIREQTWRHIYFKIRKEVWTKIHNKIYNPKDQMSLSIRYLMRSNVNTLIKSQIREQLREEINEINNN